MEKLWIITELFHPEKTSTAYILTEIAKKLSCRFDVHVICGNPVYDDESNFAPLPGITVHRISGRKINKNNKIQRAIRALTLTHKLCKCLDKNKSSVDKVLAVTNPVFLILKLSSWCKKADKNLFFIVHDLFPENAIATGIIKNPFLKKILRTKFDKAYSFCRTIIVCGNDMKKIMQKKIGSPEKIKFIPNWGDTENILPNFSNECGKKIIVQFAGNMGRVQGLKKILEIIAGTKNENLEFIFRGNGAVKSELKKIALKKKLKNVVFMNSYGRDEENKILNECDIALVSLDDSMYGLGVPSKTYNNMAAGKPVLFVGPKESEIFNEVKENEIGFAFSFEQKNDLKIFLESLSVFDRQNLVKIGMKARKRCEEIYSREKILNQYMEVIL
jgi:glycosyltransferase involved in cell wall biosynthesis